MNVSATTRMSRIDCDALACEYIESRIDCDTLTREYIETFRQSPSIDLVARYYLSFQVFYTAIEIAHRKILGHVSHRFIIEPPVNIKSADAVWHFMNTCVTKLQTTDDGVFLRQKMAIIRKTIAHINLISDLRAHCRLALGTVDC